ncbi:MAG: hypothetical protein WCE70_00045, partial [Rhodanobacteraceae bacterium]
RICAKRQGAQMHQPRVDKFAIVTVAVTAVVIPLSAFVLPKTFIANMVPECTMKGAEQALSLMKDWTIWMASLQTGMIAALGLMLKEGGWIDRLSRCQRRLAVLVALFNSVALLFSAWLLTSLPSVMLRLSRDKLPSYDFYNFPLYAYMEHSKSMGVFTVGFFVFWNHWLWAFGILAFGLLSASSMVKASITNSTLSDTRGNAMVRRKMPKVLNAHVAAAQDEDAHLDAENPDDDD